MPIEINGEKNEPYINMRGLKRRVTFRVTSAPLKARTEDGIIEKPLSSLSIPTTYTRRTLSGGHETVKYYEHKTPIVGLKGEVSYRYTPEFIEIENGEKIVDTKGAPDLYWWILNHPDNEGNPLYDTDNVSSGKDAKALLEARRTPFLFLETDRERKKKGEKSFSKDVEVAKCITLISDEKELNNKNAVVLYKAYGYTDADELVELEDYGTIRNALISQAKENPELFNKKLESAALQLEAQVNDAVHKGILVYENTGSFNGWMWGKTNKEIKRKEICPIEAHQYEQRVELLIDFLRTDKKGVQLTGDLKSELVYLKLTN